MKLIMENWKRFLNEQEEAAGKVKFAMNPRADAPTKVPLTWGANPNFEASRASAIKAAAEQLYGSEEEAIKRYKAVVAKIGGEEKLKQNLAILGKRMTKGPAYNLEKVPPRGDMPVVDPDQFDALAAALKRGDLDTKEDFADPSPMAEGVLDSDHFPDDLDTKSDDQKQYFLTKGTRDKGGAKDEDRSISFVQDQSIPVGTGYPTQQQIYTDKALFNLLNFGVTVGGPVHGSQVIAVKVGEDHYILDGHHRWASAILGSPANTMKAAIISGFTSMKDALGFLRAYGGAIGNEPRA